ncbi:CotH kinase family protein [Chitinispirillales bacterium ANBcel5]|uniref:CotH kinase family protein n=1 Tax=Cellulosispirillum alkaliphilum TaxID=3039283 RepID=UPI002A4FFB98|nr:CotH kinase family protein [Chitinispirillales bacterium ANBcel5]
MLKIVIAILLTGMAIRTLANTVDSTEILFDEEQVFNYEIQFYTPDWSDSMDYYMEIMGGEYMPARFISRFDDGDSIVLENVGVRYKGNSSYTFSRHSVKRPLKVKFDKFVDHQYYFGLKRLSFHNGVLDPSFMREKISYDIARAYMPSPRVSYANISIEGELIGFYIQVEQVDDQLITRYYEDDTGRLFKAGNDGAFMTFSVDAFSNFDRKEGSNDWSNFIDMMDKLNNTSDEEFVEVISEVLDLKSCITHLAYTMVLSHFDSYTGSGRNFYLYENPKSGRFEILPWDLDQSFGVYTNNWDVINADIVDISNLDQRPLNRRIIENDSLRNVYFDFLERMLNEAANPEQIAAEADRIKERIKEHVKNDPNKFYTYEDFLTNIEEDLVVQSGPRRRVFPGIKSLSAQRAESILSQIEHYRATSVVKNKKPDNLHQMAIRAAGNKLLLSYSVKTDAKPVTLNVYNARGSLIDSRYLGLRNRGQHTTSISLEQKAAGFYVVQLNFGDKTQSRSFIMRR